jgi:7 transmembrane receptor (rhodopsin family)
MLELVEDFVRLLQEEEDVRDNALSDAQDKALSLLPMCSGVLSAWGSGSIIHLFFQTPSEKRNVYKRIMLGLSISDFMASLVFSLQPFLLPAETSQRAYASGTDATCSAMGFLQQLAFSAIWYNGMLSFMFLLKIKYGVEENVMASKYETWMHLLAIGVPLITAIIGAALGVYAELVVGHFCWFTGELGTLLAWIFSAAPATFFLLCIPISNLLVYRHVRRTLLQVNDGHDDSNMNTALPASPESALAHNYFVEASVKASEIGESTFSDEQHREHEREEARRKSQEERQKEHIQAVAFQAFLYVASFMITHLPTFIVRMTSAIAKFEASNEADFFPLLVIQAILLPLQGLFNYLIYSRPLPYLRETS